MWNLRKTDDFPPRGHGANRALCCCCTCCIFIITGLAGAAVGGIVGGVAARKVIKKMPGASHGYLMGWSALGGLMLGLIGAVTMGITGGWDIGGSTLVLFPAAGFLLLGVPAAFNKQVAASLGPFGAGVFVFFFWVALLGGAGLFLGLFGMTNR